MLKKMIICCVSLGVGLAVLVGIGVGQGIGSATALTIEGIARNPAIADLIIEAFLIGIWYILIPLFVASIVAIVFLIVAKRSCSPARVPWRRYPARQFNHDEDTHPCEK